MMKRAYLHQKWVFLSREGTTGDDVNLESGHWCIFKARAVGKKNNLGTILISKLEKYFVRIKLRIMQARKKRHYF